jgi:hypothetical protein
MQIHKEFRGIPGDFTAKNTAEFRGIPYVFEKIPYSVGSQKRTSVDTLILGPLCCCWSGVIKIDMVWLHRSAIPMMREGIFC